MHRIRKHYSTKSRRFDLSIVHRHLDAEGSSVLQAETNRVHEKMQNLKEVGRKEQVLKEETERELEKVKEQLKVATEEKNKLEQRLKDEEEKKPRARGRGSEEFATDPTAAIRKRTP